MNTYFLLLPSVFRYTHTILFSHSIMNTSWLFKSRFNLKSPISSSVPFKQIFPIKSSLLKLDFMGPNYFIFLVTPRANHVVWGRQNPFTEIYALVTGLLDETLHQFLSSDLISFEKWNRESWLCFQIFLLKTLLQNSLMYSNILLFSFPKDLQTSATYLATQGSRQKVTKESANCLAQDPLSLFSSFLMVRPNSVLRTVWISFKSDSMFLVKFSQNYLQNSLALAWCCLVRVSTWSYCLAPLSMACKSQGVVFSFIIV